MGGAGGNGCEIEPTQFCPQVCQARILLLGQALGNGRVSSPAERGRMEDDSSRPWEGSPGQGMKMAPGLPMQSSSGSRICPLLASSSQAMAQVSDTWGLESHARKPNTLGSQPPTSSSYEQAGLLKKEAGLQSRAAGRLLPGGGQPRRRLSPQIEVRGFEEREDRAERGGVEKTKLEQAEGWMFQEKR